MSHLPTLNIKKFTDYMVKNKFLKFDDECLACIQSYFYKEATDICLNACFIKLDNIIDFDNYFNDFLSIDKLCNQIMQVIKYYDGQHETYIFTTEAIDNKELCIIKNKTINNKDVYFPIYELLYGHNLTIFLNFYTTVYYW